MPHFTDGSDLTQLHRSDPGDSRQSTTAVQQAIWMP